MDSTVYFISMEGRSNFKIGNFEVREDIALPVLVNEGTEFKADNINPEAIIGGMIKIIMENPDNDHIDYYREFIFSVQPDIETRLSSGAYEAENHGDYKDSIDIYRTLIALNPKSEDNILNIAVCYDEYSQFLNEKGKENEALKMEELAFDFFKLVEDIDDKSDRVYYYLGRFFAYRENYEKAILYFEEFVKMTDDAEHKIEVKNLIKQIKTEGLLDDDYNSAYELVNSDKDSESIEFIDKYLKKYPVGWQGHFLKGLALRKSEKYKEAIESLLIALQYNDKSSDIHNELGLCHMNLALYPKGEYYFSQALKINPEDLTILTNLSMLYLRRGNKKEALRYCEIALEFDANDKYAKELKKIIEEKQ